MRQVSVALLSLVVGVFMMGNVALANDAAKLFGEYKVEGKAPDGTTYDGTATIAAGEKEGTIQVTWKLNLPETKGPTELAGPGTLQADGTWKVIYTGAESGEQTYKVNADGSLEGSYTDETGTGTEKLIPVKAEAK